MPKEKTKASRKFPRSIFEFQYTPAADSHNVSESKHSFPLFTSTPKKTQSPVITSANKPSSSAIQNINELMSVDSPWTRFQFPINKIESSKPICMVGGYAVKNNDLFTLLPQKWVNDKIIDSFSLKYCYSEYLSSHYAKVLSNSTHFVKWLKCGCTSPSMFWSWIYQQKPMNHDIWIIPLNENNSRWGVAIFVLKLNLIVGSNAGVSEPGFLNFFARDVWRALSVLSITMKR